MQPDNIVLYAIGTGVSNASIDTLVFLCNIVGVNTAHPYPGIPPIIRSGSDNSRRDRRPLPITAEPGYQLVVVEDGSVAYRSGGAQLAPPTPYGLFIEPLAKVRMSLPRGVTWYHLRFYPGNVDPIHRPGWRRSAGADEFADVVRFPSPRELWDVEIPLEIPSSLLPEATRIIKWCDSHYWRRGTNEARTSLRLGTLLLDLIDNARGLAPVEPGWLERLRHHCSDNVQQNISVQDLADFAGFSRQHLLRRLRAECGMTPRELLEGIRIQEACRLLRSTRGPLDGIRKRCGYASPRVFSKAFKRCIGRTPSTWRRENREY